MKILAIDTSGQQAGAAIMDEYITIGEILINAQSGPKSWHHSEILMPAIERLFTLSGQELTDMDYIAYTAGPGSFTGLRIGAATALGLARGINRPSIAVPTLDALAYNMLSMIAVNDESGDSHGLIVPLMDARRGQVYAAIYRTEHSGKLTRLTDYFASSIEETLEQVCMQQKAHSQCRIHNIPTIYLGDGANANKDTILAHHPTAKFAPPHANRQRPASVALCALHQLESTAPQINDPINLIYVRDPQAVRTAKNL